MAGKCKYCGFVGTNDEMANHAGEMCQGDYQPDTMEEMRHNHQHRQPAICPKCKQAIQVYYTGRSLCSNVRCDYDGPGIQQAGA